MFARGALAVLLLAGVAAAAAPKQYPTALEALQSNKQLTVFTNLTEYAGLKPYLESPYTRATIFAPNNAAINKALSALKLKATSMGAAEYQMLVDRIVGYHIVTRDAPAGAQAAGAPKQLTSSNGGKLVVEVAAPAAAKVAAPKPAAKPKPAARRFLSEIWARLLQATPVAAVAPLVTAPEPTAAAVPKPRAAPKAPRASMAAPVVAPTVAPEEFVSIQGVQNSAKVVGKPIKGGNVTVYVIDTVLLPDTVFPTIKDALAYSGVHKQLAALIANDTKLAKAAANPKTNVTLFAPIDSSIAALAEIPAAQKILANPAQLSKLLSYHAAEGARILPGMAAKEPESLPTLVRNANITVTKVVTPAAAGKAATGVIEVLANSKDAKPVTVKKFNIIAGASLIHVVDGVLVPK
ncbi:MAG: hypothetical protein J3K34DRAFT_426941 [Monoraphidium minutum]|nr:MAG: hypothetical protein J3K34DRAFT_426941 [Monoraphidium minutum]